MSFAGFSRTDYAFNSGQFTSDGGITAQYPGLILTGTETNAELQVVREVNGDCWILTNCDINKTTGLFTQTNSAQKSYGLQLAGQLSGAVNRFSKNVGAIPWNPISGWDAVIPIGGGGGGGGTLQSLTDIDQTTQFAGYVLSVTPSGGFPFSWVDPTVTSIAANAIVAGSFESGVYKFPSQLEVPSGIYFGNNLVNFPSITASASGDPNGSITAQKGSLLLRYDGGAGVGSRVYVNQNGATTWIAIAGV